MYFLFYIGVVENLEEEFSSASEPLFVNRESVALQSVYSYNQSRNEVVDVHIVSSEEESSTTHVGYGEENNLCENQMKESQSERYVEDLAEVPAVEEEINANAVTLMTAAEALMTVADPQNIVKNEDKIPASLTVRMEIDETRLTCNTSSGVTEGIMEEAMVDSEPVEAAVLTGSMLKDAVMEPTRERRGGKYTSNMMEQGSSKYEQYSAEIKFQDGKTTEGIKEDSPDVSLATKPEGNGSSQTTVFESCSDNKNMNHSESGGKGLLKPGEPSHKGNEACAVENASKDFQVHLAESTKEQGYHGVPVVTSSLLSSCSTLNTQSVNFSVSHTLEATCASTGEECKEATKSPVGPNLLSSHFEHHHGMLQKVHNSVDPSSNAVVDVLSTLEDKSAARKHYVCDNLKTIGITAHLNVDQFHTDAVLFTENNAPCTTTASSSSVSSISTNCVKLIGGSKGYGETKNQRFHVTQPPHESTCEKQECASASCKAVTFCPHIPPSSILYSSPSTEKSSQREQGTSTSEDTSIVKVGSVPLEVHFVETSVCHPAHCVAMKGMIQHNGEIITTSGITVTLDSYEMQIEEGSTHSVARVNQECTEEEHSHISLPNLNMCRIDLPDTMGPKQSTCRNNGQELLTALHSREITGSKSEEIHVKSTLCVSALLSDLVLETIKEIESALSQNVKEEISDIFSPFGLPLPSDDQPIPSLYREKTVYTFCGNSQFILAVDHVQSSIPSHNAILNHHCTMKDISTPSSACSVQPTVTKRPLFSQNTWRSSDITARLPLESEDLPLQLRPKESTVPLTPQHKCATKTILPAKDAKEPCTPPCDTVEAVESFAVMEGMFLVCLYAPTCT